jgi:serine/threonine protein phosphatase PrpC
VIPIPEVKIHKIDNHTSFVIIGCDGIWDCISSKDCMAFFAKRISSEVDFKPIIGELMDSIIASEIENCRGKGNDNMTCIVIYFKE